MPIPYIIAVVAVFEIHAEIAAVTAPTATRIRVGRAPTQRRPKHRVGDAPVETVQEDGAREDERADEEKDQRVGEGGEDVLRRGHAENHAGRGTEQGGHRQRQRLGDPQHHHRAKDAGKPMGLGTEAG